MTGDALYMRRCIDLAYGGLGMVAPNPLVGAVVVHEDRIIGEGFHERFGGPHAEVNAINAVEDKNLLSSSSLYVNLEPCCHFGKTPPCTDMIIRYKVPRVVAGSKDPSEKINGKGLELLKQHGVKVITGVESELCTDLNKRFFTYHNKHRPYVILKWAQTPDGYIGVRGMGRYPVSNEHSLELSRKWRSLEGSIMVGTGTAAADNPRLTSPAGKNPVRIVVDRKLSLAGNLHLFDGSVKTFVFTEKEKTSSENIEYVRTDSSLFNKNNLLPQILYFLYLREIQSLIVEGGAGLLQSFIDSGIWDEARVFTGQHKINTVDFSMGIKAPSLGNREPYEKRDLTGDVLSSYFNNGSL